MSYVDPNYKTKKAFKDAVAAGKRHYIYNVGPFPEPENGFATVEGPHYPAPHRWYARVEVRYGLVVVCEKVKLGQSKPAELPPPMPV